MDLRTKKAFTLAEMMVVLLVMSLIMAAFLPVMTKRTKASGSGGGGTDLWTYEGGTGPANIYWSEGDTLGAIIGADKSNSAMLARLFINKPSTMANDILFQETTAGVSADTGTLTVDGKGNVGLGDISLDSTKNSQIAIGSGAITAGTGAIAIGSGVKTNANTYDVAIGDNANSGTNGGNVAIGYDTLSANSGGYSTAIGYHALNSNTGLSNTAVGYGSLEATTSGNNNAALGYNSLWKNTMGGYNTGVGMGAIPQATTGNYNTGVGNGSLLDLITGSQNTAIGYQACSNVTGSNKTCIGANSGPTSGTNATDSIERIFIGGPSYHVNFSGGGTHPQALPANSAIVEIHNNANSSSSDSATVVINANLIVRGQTFYTNQNGTQLHIWDSGGATIGSSSDSFGTPLSDRRLKNVKGLNAAGLEQIKKLKTYNYTYKKDKEKIPHVGVIAQDLQKVFPDAVTKGNDGYFRIRQDDMFYAMLNSIKQLDTIIQSLVKDFKSLVVRVQAIDDKILALIKVDQVNVNKIKELDAKNKSLEARVDKLERLAKNSK